MNLIFHAVEAYCVTQWSSVSSVKLFSAYEKLVEVGGSRWLRKVQAAHERATAVPTLLKHLRVAFDDYPCYSRYHLVTDKLSRKMNVTDVSFRMMTVVPNN